MLPLMVTITMINITLLLWPEFNVIVGQTSKSDLSCKLFVLAIIIPQCLLEHAIKNECKEYNTHAHFILRFTAHRLEMSASYLSSDISTH